MRYKTERHCCMIRYIDDEKNYLRFKAITFRGDSIVVEFTKIANPPKDFEDLILPANVNEDGVYYEYIQDMEKRRRQLSDRDIQTSVRQTARDVARISDDVLNFQQRL